MFVIYLPDYHTHKASSNLPEWMNPFIQAGIRKSGAVYSIMLRNLFVVMIFATINQYFLVKDLINKSVLSVNSPRPKSG